MDSNIKTFTKIDAAKEQIETAIRLFFNYDSVVSIHTLCSAAFGILKDISKKIDSDFSFELEVRIKPEYLSLYWNKLNAPANFFKHADKDPDGSLEFNEQINDLKLMYCCWGYKDVSGTRTPIMNAYMTWMLSFYPHLFNLGDEESRMIRLAQDSFKNENWDRKQKQLAGRMLLANLVVEAK